MTVDALTDAFDVVVMLTWSDWKTEPRSNRYHYATRFSGSLPVLFVQPRFMDPEVDRTLEANLMVEGSGIDGLDICHYDQDADRDSADEFVALLRARGHHRPLVWIYNPRDFGPLLAAFREAGNGFFVYHATENYFTHSESAAGLEQQKIRDLVTKLCSDVDVIIGVSESVSAAYRSHIEFDGVVATVENGCDAAFAAQRIGTRTWQSPPRPVAIYQGGINPRLDFALLRQLAIDMPDWDFRFCGRQAEAQPDWDALASLPNVQYLGELDPAALGDRLFDAVVGLIPFVQDPWIRESLPLKAFEYLSYGLPVVTVPIDSLRNHPDAFVEARTAPEFAAAMRAAAEQRAAPARIDERLSLAAENSYDSRFHEVVKIITDARAGLSEKREPLNVVMLYDERWTHISTIQEHLDSFRKYSRNEFHYLPATGKWAVSDDDLDRAFDLSLFDVVIVHYSLRVSLEDYFSEGIARQVERHRGLKILFIQDEYERTETSRRWMERLQFHVVYTCVPEDGRAAIYPPYRFPGTEFRSTLTGYVPETGDLDRFAMPLDQRALHIGYRGRILPFVYGRLGNEKYRIGVEVKRLAMERGMHVDIEVDDSKRIYGDGWYRFLGSARATLGTESGSSIFDFTGEVAEAIAREESRSPGITFEEMQERVLDRFESPVRMNQVSPKIFEAIRLRTALILFEGEYSGVVQPDVHFIPLRKDFGNIEEVFRKLEDLEYLSGLTERAYQDVIESDRYSYQRFVEEFDADLEQRHRGQRRVEIVSVPAFARKPDGSFVTVLARDPAGFVLANRVLGGVLQREQVMEQVRDVLASPDPSAPPAPAPAPVPFADITVAPDLPPHTAPEPAPKPRLVVRVARFGWHLLPAGMRTRMVVRARGLLDRHVAGSQTTSLDYRIARRVFRALPARLRARLVQIFGSQGG
ncbi:MAG: hypothetical protein KC729_13870 [Candidatus Eisenbacteria bacterium]|uniref:Glycosyltransferase n=1 Tax=Eiseniibacteriota bacterium TaxID=2212470 RepID=A0A956RQ16_UNCEI|nr:hypothetical protein [Candidatus Eisenbacteria bacterium]